MFFFCVCMYVTATPPKVKIEDYQFDTVVMTDMVCEKTSDTNGVSDNCAE